MPVLFYIDGNSYCVRKAYAIVTPGVDDTVTVYQRYPNHEYVLCTVESVAFTFTVEGNDIMRVYLKTTGDRCGS